MQLNLSTLQTLVEVVRQGSFAAVARERNVDPSSVSRAIANLEKDLGIRLFQRTTRQLSLTEAGAVYYERVEPLIDELKGAIAAAKEVSNQPKGTLRITTSVSFGIACIVPHLPLFEARYPELSIELILSDSVLDLVNERIDIAIRLGQMADSTLMARRLMPTQYFVCASPAYLAKQGHPHYPQALSKHECLCFALKGFRSRWLFKGQGGKGQGGEAKTVLVRGRTVISNAIALRDCVLSGMGIALLPNWLVQADLAAGNLVNVFPHYAVTATTFETAAWFVYPSKKHLPLKVKVLMDFLKEELCERSETNAA